MAYQPFTLKYRPRTFEDVIGQDHVSRTLRNAIAAGRLVHAYLFTGPRGTGKTTMARILARALNCVKGITPDPCGECDMCLAVSAGRALDVIEIDAASHTGVDAIRELREQVKYSPGEGRCKLYILDEVHMLSISAFNALLKTLEEPPAHAYFALLTTEMHKVPETIVSRCQRFEFRPISIPEVIGALRKIADNEGLQIQDAALHAIATAAEGGLRDAQSILEQVVAFSEGEITLEVANQVLGVTDTETLARIAEIVAAHDLPAAFTMVDHLVAEGKDLGRLIEDLTLFFRDLLRLALGSGGENWLQLGAEGQERMRGLAQTIGSDALLAAVHELAELRGKMKTSSQHALLLELALAELTQPRQAAVSLTAVSPSLPGAPQPRSAGVSPAPGMAGLPPSPQPGRTGVAPVAPPSMGAPPPRTAGVSPAPVAAAAQDDTAPAEKPTEPDVPAQNVAGDLTCAAIYSRWPLLLEQLKRMNYQNVRALLLNAVPTRVTADSITVSFPSRCQFHHNQLKSSHCDTVSKALHKLFGQNLRVECRLCPAGEDPAVPADEAMASPPAAVAPVPEPPPASEHLPSSEPAPAAGRSAPLSATGEELPPGMLASPPAPTEGANVPSGDPAPAPELVPPPAVAPSAPASLELSSPPPALQDEPETPAAGGLTADAVVEQTLSLFEGSQEVLPPNQ